MKRLFASGLGAVTLLLPALGLAGPGSAPTKGTRSSTVASVRTSTVAASALDRELAQYLVLLESWDDVKDLELLELLPVLEDEDE